MVVLHYNQLIYPHLISSNVTDMLAMFSYCSSLKSIDLSSFNTSNVKVMDFMFDNCSSLKKENIKINNNEKNILKKFDEKFITCNFDF